MAAEGQIYLVASYRNQSGAVIPVELSVNIAATGTNYYATDTRTNQTFSNVKQNCQLVDFVLSTAATNHFTIKVVMNGSETGQTYMSSMLSPSISPRIVPLNIPTGILQFKFYQSS